MTTSDIQVFYNDQKLMEAWTADILAALETGKIADFSSLPENHFDPDEVVRLRSSPAALEDFFNRLNQTQVTEILKAVEEAMQTEARQYLIAEAAQQVGSELNYPPEGEYMRTARDDRDASRARLTTLTLFIDQLQDEPDDETNAMTRTLATLRLAEKPAFLADLRSGSIYTQMRDFQREKTAWEYLKTANAYNTSLALLAAVQIVRVMADPDAFKGEKSEAILSMIRSDADKARVMTGLARQTMPGLEPEPGVMPQLRGPGPKPN